MNQLKPLKMDAQTLVQAYPLQVEAFYRDELLKMVNSWKNRINLQLVPQLDQLIASHDRVTNDSLEIKADEIFPEILTEKVGERVIMDTLKNPKIIPLIKLDGWSAEAENIINNMSVSFGKDMNIVIAQLRDIAQGANVWNFEEWDVIVKNTLGVNVFSRESWVHDHLNSFINVNTSLITELKDQTLNSIRFVVNDGIIQGQRAETIAKRLVSEAKLQGIPGSSVSIIRTAEKRSKFIARDQIAKLNGNLTQQRHKDLDIEEYIWHTSEDERVRSTHMSHNNKRFKWGDPPSNTGHPGQDYQCRCWAEAVFEEIEDLI